MYTGNANSSELEPLGINTIVIVQHAGTRLCNSAGTLTFETIPRRSRWGRVLKKPMCRQCGARQRTARSEQRSELHCTSQGSRCNHDQSNCLHGRHIARPQQGRLHMPCVTPCSVNLHRNDPGHELCDPKRWSNGGQAFIQLSSPCPRGRAIQGASAATRND